MIELIILLGLAYLFRNTYTDISDQDVEDYIVYDHLIDQ